jgi:hypothetical protein
VLDGHGQGVALRLRHRLVHLHALVLLRRNHARLDQLAAACLVRLGLGECRLHLPQARPQLVVVDLRQHLTGIHLVAEVDAERLDLPLHLARQGNLFVAVERAYEVHQPHAGPDRDRRHRDRHGDLFCLGRLHRRAGGLAASPPQNERRCQHRIHVRASHER